MIIVVVINMIGCQGAPLQTFQWQLRRRDPGERHCGVPAAEPTMGYHGLPF